MKLVMAIINADDSQTVINALNKDGFSVTRLATTGGFLMSGNTTMLIGTEEDKVEEVIGIIGENSRKRTKIVASNSSFNSGMYAGMPVEVTVGGATIFVVDVERYEKL